MPIYNQVYTYTVPNGGGTISLDVTDSTTTRYIFSGTPTLSSSFTIQPTGTPVQGMEFDIRWQCSATVGVNTVTIFGTTLTTAQALVDLIATCYYNGSAWDVDIQQDSGISVTNGLGYISGSLGLGGSLTQDTTITGTDTNTLTVTHTAGSINGNDVSFIMGEPVPGTTFDGLTFLTSSDIYGTISRTDSGSVDQISVAFTDTSNGNFNGLSVLPTQMGLAIYDPTGASQVGYTAYDGTGGFTHTADMFWYNTALDLDVTLIQAKETEGMVRFAYDTTPGSEEYNSISVNSAGITLDATGGIADDRFITVTGFLQNFANDGAAAAGGVPVGALYRNGSVVQIRVV